MRVGPKTQKDLLERFVHGETNTKVGDLRSEDRQVIHYSTPILEDCGGFFILNNLRYSLATGRIQKLISEMIPEQKLEKPRCP